MRINYKILWIDDDEELVDLLKPDIDKYLDSLGFRLSVKHLEDGDNTEELPKSDHEYDLILLDYSLGDEKKTGEEIIKNIQGDDFTIETLFYSSQPGFTEKINKIGGLQRTSFCEGKSNLLDKIKKVIELSIRKVQDVSNMRGLVIAEVIDIEMKMEKILCDFFGVCEDQTKRGGIIKKAVEDAENWFKTEFEKMQKYKPEQISEFIESKFFSLHNKRKAISDLINEKISELEKTSIEGKEIIMVDLKRLKDEVGKMYDEVTGHRNLMAHAKEEKNLKNIPVLVNNKHKTEIDRDKCIQIRSDLKKHDSNLDQIHKLLNGHDE